jgi:S-DNA-T family DNA segregation ATPase FtsK/SpoIIIE
VSVCPDCDFRYGALPRHQLVTALRAGGEAYAPRLATDSTILRTRREPGEWSPLEYACHVRDVSLMQRDRLYVALVEDEPSFKPMYRDQRVAFDRYNLQSPSAVAAEVAMATALFAGAFEGLGDDQWGRPLIYGFPEATHRDVEWVGHHTLHEITHHLADIDRILDAS